MLQRIRDLCEKGWSFDAALEEVRRTTVFTTHTPVAAGHDAFPFHLVETHLAGAWGDLGGHRERFLALGHYDNGAGPMFNMTALALRTSGVRQRRQQAARRSHQADVAVDLAGHAIRRAAHAVRHQRGARADLDVSGDRARCFEAHLGPDWLERHDDPALAERVLTIPDEELWARAADRCERSCSTSFASARADGGARRSTPSRVVAGRDDARSEHADDRIRAPLHGLQTAGADLLGRRSARADSQRERAARAARVRRQGASGRRGRQASPPADLQARARSRGSAAASPSSTTTTCTSRTSSCRDATSG